MVFKIVNELALTAMGRRGFFRSQLWAVAVPAI